MQETHCETCKCFPPAYYPPVYLDRPLLIILRVNKEPEKVLAQNVGVIHWLQAVVLTSDHLTKTSIELQTDNHIVIRTFGLHVAQHFTEVFTNMQNGSGNFAKYKGEYDLEFLVTNAGVDYAVI